MKEMRLFVTIEPWERSDGEPDRTPFYRMKVTINVDNTKGIQSLAHFSEFERERCTTDTMLKSLSRSKVYIALASAFDSALEGKDLTPPLPAGQRPPVHPAVTRPESENGSERGPDGAASQSRGR